MNYNDRMKVYRTGLLLKESMACKFETTNALGVFSWGVGVSTNPNNVQKANAVMHIPITYFQFPETQFQGIDYAFYLVSPKGYASDFRWIIQSKRVQRNHVTYLLREA